MIAVEDATEERAREKCILILLYSVEDATEERAMRLMPFILLKWSGASSFTDEYIRSITSLQTTLILITSRPNLQFYLPLNLALGAFTVVVVGACSRWEDMRTSC